MGRREEKAEKTKANLMKSALTLFRNRGYDGVSVEEITRAAGVAKGTFYSYFETKSDIIVEEFWKIDRFYESYASRNLRRYTGAGEKLLAFTRAQMRYVRDEVGVENLKILYANQVSGVGGDRVIVNPERRWYRIVEDIITGGLQTGEFRNTRDARVLASEFNRSMRSVFLDWCIADGEFDLPKAARSYCEDWLIPVLRGN